MFWKILLAALAAALVIFLLWWARGAMLCPVRLGRHTALSLVLRVSGAEPALEETLDALVWLRENGTLRGNIIVVDAGMDDDTRRTAELAARRMHGVELRGGCNDTG